MNDQPMYLVCVPAHRMLHPVDGSFVAPCSRCDIPVWVSPSSQKLIHNVTIVCPDCANKAADAAQKDGDPLKFGGFIPGQLDELKAHLDDPAEPPQN